MRAHRSWTTVAALTFATAATLASHVDAARATNSCKATAGRGRRDCRAAAQGGKWRALGKCANLSDSTARDACEQQATADATDALKSCKEQDGLRQMVCKQLGPAPYLPAIAPANF